MQVDCPNCASLIDDPDINVQTDVAFCRACDSGHRLSELVHDETGVAGGFTTVDEPIDVDIYNPPKGAWFEQTGSDIRVGATCRIPALALFLVPFTAVWAGGSMVGIYGSQIAEGEFDIVRTLFGIPFLLGSIALVSMTLFVLFGRTEVIVRDQEGEVFTGIGPIGRRRRFNTADVRFVSLKTSDVTVQSNGGKRHRPMKFLEIEGDKPLKFATMMSEERRRFILGVLRTLLGK